MSRSIVVRRWPWACTATPAMIVKSIACRYSVAMSSATSSATAGGPSVRVDRRAFARAAAISSCVALRFHDADCASRCVGVSRWA